MRACAGGKLLMAGAESGKGAGREFNADFKLSQTNPRGLSQEELTLTLPFNQVAEVSGYRIAVGLKPTQEELDYNRRNDHYRPGHVIARMFLRNLAVNDLYSPGTGESFAFLIDMNKLFEDFVTQLLVRAFAGTDVRVRPQARDRTA